MLYLSLQFWITPLILTDYHINHWRWWNVPESTWVNLTKQDISRYHHLLRRSHLSAAHHAEFRSKIIKKKRKKNTKLLPHPTLTLHIKSFNTYKQAAVDSRCFWGTWGKKKKRRASVGLKSWYINSDERELYHVLSTIFSTWRQHVTLSFSLCHDILAKRSTCHLDPSQAEPFKDLWSYLGEQMLNIVNVWLRENQHL